MSDERKTAHLLAVGALALSSVLLVTAAPAWGSSTTSTKPKVTKAAPKKPAPKKPGNADDIAFIKSNRHDLLTVAAGIADVETEIGQAASNSATQADVNQLAMTAQQLHDSFDTIHSNLAANNSDLSNGAVEVFTASGELRDAMYDLVSYTGTPNPKTLATFSTQYSRAVADWNQGVTDLWSSAKESGPPTIASGS